MRTLLLVASSLCFILLLHDVSADEFTLACDTASRPVDRLICNSDRLKRQHLKLTELTHKALGRVSEQGREQLKQDEWLAKRYASCESTAGDKENCLYQLYQDRINQLASIVAFDSSNLPENEELKILRITPDGDDVAAGRQIVFQFDRPVVPIGRMDRQSEDIPITITPALKCEWRWINTSALACQLRREDQMQSATRYDVEIKPGISTENGATLKDKQSHTFITARPKVTYSRFINWLSPGTPLIQVTFNQPVTKKSVEQALFIDSYAEDTALIAYPDDIPRRLPWWLAITNEQEQPKVDDRLTEVAGEEARRVWVVEPVKELALDETVSLEVTPGLESSAGPEPGVELRTVVNFDTFPQFEFLGIRCTPKGERRAVDILSADLSKPVDEQIRCAPLRPVALLFSSPVLHSTIKEQVDFSPPLDGGRKDYDPWQNSPNWTRLGSPHRRGRHYQIWLPELLQAYEQYQVDFMDELLDEFGRKLVEPVNFQFYTGHREPDLRLSHHIAVLEKEQDSDVPVYVTNLNNVGVRYDSMTKKGTEKSLYKDIAIPAVEDVAFAVPLGVRELLNDDSGMIFAGLYPQPLPPTWGYSAHRQIVAQVTPYQTHYKVGHFNSVIWVTDFAKGKPVKSATVTLYTGSYKDLAGLESLDITVKTDRNGLAELPGLAEIDPELELIYGGYRVDIPGLYAKIEKGDDIAVIPLSYDYAVRGNGVYSRIQKKGGHTHSWGTTAQGIYKLGDTIEFKIYVRDQSNRHWVPSEYTDLHLKVIDPQGKTVFEDTQVSLNEFGSFHNSFKVAEQGAVGWYRFVLTPQLQHNEKYPRFTWTPMSVLVSDFTPAPFKVSNELNGSLFKPKEKVHISSAASLHAGGPFADAEVRLTARLQAKPFHTTNPQLKSFTFGRSNNTQLNSDNSRLLDIRSQLNSHGQHEEAFILPDADIYYGSLLVETAVKDDRGKFIASTQRADYAGRTRYVGLRNTNWLYEKDKTARLESVVVNSSGSLAVGESIEIVISHREYKAARVKGPGNAYLTQNLMQWVEETRCNIISGNTPVTCEFTPQHPGYYQFVASIKDTQQREHSTTIHGWVTGSGAVVWDQRNDATLEIIPEQTDYKIGDTARYLIKNPFPGAKALVTVERYGILESWVETLKTSTPVIEVPIKPDYLPGFYLSVVAVSPRVDKPLGPNKVDLGKPSYRMGYVAARVSDPYKQLAIEINTDQDTYRPRDTVTADIKVTPKKGYKDAPYEIAVAVVDESVLAMNNQGETYYDPYQGFNRLDALDVNNYSLISRLLGRQKFEKKGANPGGGGGDSYSTLRNIFKFVSYWNPSITPDKNGKAQIQFTVPDNLTGWRIFAMAVTPSDRMGLGNSNIKVNKETEIRPVMPNQLVEGDSFKAGFSVMNRSEQEREIQVDIIVNGPMLDRGELQTAKQSSYQLKLPPYKRENIWLPIKTKGHGILNFTVKAGDRSDQDAIQHTVTVNKRRSLETAANYGTITADRVTESIKIPDDIYTDVGGVSAVLSATVIGNVDGAFKYIKDYPYYCWEQRLTKAVIASAYQELEEYIDDTVDWPMPQQDIDNALQNAASFQAPNGGMVYWTAKDRHVSPYLSAYTAMAFNWLRRSGHIIPTHVEERLHGYLLSLLRRDVFPTFYSAGMSSSVRAVALAALAESGKISKYDIQRYASHVSEMDLFGKAHFLQAAIITPDTKPETIEKTLQQILGNASQTGGKFQFNEPWDDSYRYILATPLRSNCTILSSLLAAQLEAQAGEMIGDIPFKLVRSITQSRGKRQHWENTQENVFCLNALIDYATVYESTEPDMQIKVSFADETIGEASFTEKAAPAVTLTRAMRDGDAGKAGSMTIEKEGDGRLYYSARVAYDLKEDNAARINSGIEIRREYSVERDNKFVLLKSPMQIQRGELVKVDLFVSVPTARHFVVINDPVPGGLEPVNTDFATTSTVDAAKGDFKMAEESWFYQLSGWTYYGRYFWSFYHKELRHDSARFYADYLPVGNYHLSYTAQAIAEGDFSVMPTHGEEMYDPDVYGKGLPFRLHVKE